MIIIPEIETVLILVPRTGTGSLRRAVAARYPRSYLIYRHMEADGVPHGYDHYRRVGLLRHPTDRLISLYYFLKNFTPSEIATYPEYAAAQRRSVEGHSFSDWVVNNKIVFTSPYVTEARGGFVPQYTVNHPLPENWKSQHHYLRPDLGTEIVLFDRLAEFAAEDLDLKVFPHLNQTDTPNNVVIDRAARAHIFDAFRWDLGAFSDLWQEHTGRSTRVRRNEN